MVFNLKIRTNEDLDLLCDDERADFNDKKKDIHDKFSVEVCPVTIPMGTGADFKGVINVLEGKAYFIPAEGKIEEASEIPADYQDDYKDALGVLAGAAAEGDDDLLVKFIDEGELTTEEIVKGLQIAFRNNRIVPIFAGNPIKNSGLKSVLDFIIDIAPDPTFSLESAVSDTDEKVTVKVNPDEDMKALVVKTSSDQFAGKLSYIKVVTGKLTSDSEVFNIQSEKKKKIGYNTMCL